MRFGFPCLFLATSLSVFGVTFTASLDRTSVVIGEQVTLTLSFEGGQPQQISGLPPINGLNISQGSQTMNSSVGPNGATTIYAYTLGIEPTRAGEFVIPAFQAKVNGETLSSQPVKLKVAATDSFAPPAELAGRPAFLWFALPKKELFIGETLVGEIRLYIRNDIRRISNPQIPVAGDGFTFSKLVEGPRSLRRVGANTFTVIPYSVAITPVKTGNLTLGPINGSVVLNNRDPFDFESMFGASTQPQQAALPVEALTLQVLPLPRQNVPPDFNGAVGHFTMTASAGPTNVAVGDPITVKTRIAGEGQFDALTLPEQSAWHDFKIYPPTTKVETRDQFGIQGVKTFEQVVIPQNTDIQALPATSFSYFDPEQKAYRSLSQPAIPLIVRPGGSTPAPVVAATRNASDPTPPASQDIVPIKQRPGAMAQIAPPLVRQPLFLALQSIPVLAFLGAFAWRRRTESLANNPRLRRQRQVAQIIREGLNELRRAAAAQDSDAFFAMVFRLLQEQLGERLNLPASAITEAVIEERLRPKGIPENTLSALHDLFQTCNLARYAPIKSSQELAALIPKLEAALRELREVKA